MLIVLTDNGKGKTSSALGMVLRGCGHNMSSVIIQFMKDDLYSEEWDSVSILALLVTLHKTGKGFCGIAGNP